MTWTVSVSLTVSYNDVRRVLLEEQCRRNHTHSLDDSGRLLERLGDNYSLDSGLCDDSSLCNDSSLRLRDLLNLGLGLHNLCYDGPTTDGGRDWLRLGLPDTYQLWIDSQGFQFKLTTVTVASSVVVTGAKVVYVDRKLLSDADVLVVV